MLQRLSIRNYALIDTIDIDLDKGLNIITGETGAGKSIILGALSLLLGQRAESRYFFNADKKCIIEGIFSIAAYGLDSLFEELELDHEAETIIRREISADGKSRAFINDTPVTLQVIKTVSEKLVAIHSQHAVLELNDEAFQLLTIDSLAGHAELLKQYSQLFGNYKKDSRKLNELEAAHQQAANELDYHQYLFNELEAAALKTDEQPQLEQELEQLNNAGTIKSNLLDAFQMLSEADQAAVSLLKQVSGRLGQVEQFNPAIAELNQRVQSAHIELKDVAAEIENLEQQVTASPASIEKVNDRLDLIYGLQQKHRVTSNQELLDIQGKLSDAIAQYHTDDNERIALQEKLAQNKQLLMEMAQKLSYQRTQVFERAVNTLTTSLQRMGMPSAQLQISNRKRAAEDFTLNGIDQLTFLFTANAGQQPVPLNKVASGGELSRLMLAVKSMISAHTALPTLIFDEIDTGISGDTALKVGQVMEELAEQLQVITITHLPQIAAKGDTHFYVHKTEQGDQTNTAIRKLNAEERVMAIAEMLSGKNPGASAVENAKELLSQK